MNLNHRYRVCRPPVRAQFPVDESLIERQERAKKELDRRGVEVRALRRSTDEQKATALSWAHVHKVDG